MYLNQHLTDSWWPCHQQENTFYRFFWHRRGGYCQKEDGRGRVQPQRRRRLGGGQRGQARELPNDDDDYELDRRFLQAKAEAAVEALADHSPSTGHSTDIYGHSQQYYHHQDNYVAFLQELLSDTKRFPGFPRHSDGTVIVDTHPDYAPPRTNEVIGDNKCQGTHGYYALELQCGPIYNKNGKASCLTFELMLQSLILIDPRYWLRIINHSGDILPSQVSIKDEHG